LLKLNFKLNNIKISAGEKSWLCGGYETTGETSLRMLWVLEHFHGEETSCVPTKVLVITVTLLHIDAIKWSSGILDLLLDLYYQNS
jgi:hypothetical protein